MSTYASQADVENYIEGWVTDDPFALERLIRQAERDVDRILKSLNRRLAPTQVITLQGATTGNLIFDWHGATPASTAAQPYNESAAQLAASLGALADIGVANVTVIGGYPIWTVIWDPGWASTYTGMAVPLLTLNPSSTTDGVTKIANVAARKINPLTDIDVNQAQMLSNAVCAQVEYRNSMGPGFFVRGQYASVRGPDFATTGKLPKIGPRVREELTGSGLILTQARATITRRKYGIGTGTTY